MFGAELCRLKEQLLDHGVVLEVPVDARLRHQHGDVPLQLVVVLLQTRLHHVVVARDAGVLYLLGETPQLLDVLGTQLVKFAVSFFLGCLVEDEVFQKFKIFLA